VSGLVVFMDRARFPNGLPEGVTMHSALRRTRAPVAGAEISDDYRRGWESVLAEVRTHREARSEHLIVVRHRRQGW
jgi:hypothetical protein